MKVIDDKEVGKIWKREKSAAPDMFGLQIDILELIRKLVQERIHRFEETSHITRMVDEEKHAIASFDIDPADWKDDD